MTKNSILIRNITNLTDARYFAAMGVDWMSMELSEDPVSFSTWHSVREWISGVKLAAELKSEDESVLARTIIDVKPEGIVSDNLDIVHLTGGIHLFLLSDKMNYKVVDELYAQIILFDPNLELPYHQLPENIYLQADWTPEWIIDLKNKDFSGGFCFRATGETMTGIKDYSEMDAMLELIRK